MKIVFDPEEFESRNLPFKVNRLSPTIGGELLGIDLSKPLSKELKDLIYEALVVYKVIFFRDQNITREQHINFGRNFGELEVHPFAHNSQENPEVLKIIRNKENKKWD